MHVRHSPNLVWVNAEGPCQPPSTTPCFTTSPQSAFGWDQFGFICATAALSFEAFQHTLLMHYIVTTVLHPSSLSPSFYVGAGYVPVCMQPAK